MCVRSKLNIIYCILNKKKYDYFRATSRGNEGHHRDAYKDDAIAGLGAGSLLTHKHVASSLGILSLGSTRLHLIVQHSALH